MASKDERDTIKKVSGIRSPPVPIIPDHAGRWKGSPKPIQSISYSRPFGNTAVRNPYNNIGQSNIHQRTNPTANRTLLTEFSRPNSRSLDPRRRVVSTHTREKGKGKAREPHSPPSQEIIDVDAEPASTDDLDLIAGPSSMTSPYFSSKREPSTRIDDTNGRSAGASLVADGRNTVILRNKINGAHHIPPNGQGHDPQKRNSSPIGSFSDDEVQVQGNAKRQHNKPTSHVGTLVAKFDGMSGQRKAPVVSTMPLVPVINFKKPSMKDRMQPKPSNKHNSLKFIPSLPNDSLSDPSLGSGSAKTKASVFRLPISVVTIGELQSHKCQTVIFDDREKTMAFQGMSNEFIGPIEITPKNFRRFEYSDPVDETIHPSIFHFKLAPTGRFDSMSDFSSVFNPDGGGNQGQISIKFDTLHEKWSPEIYFATADRVRRMITNERTGVIRPSASKSIWNAATNHAKYRSGDPTSLPDDPYDPVQPAEVPNTLANDQHSKDALSVESSKHQIDQLQKYRHSPASDSAVPVRKRSSNRENEVTGTEPPSKKRRVEEPRAVRRSTRQQEKFQNYDADEVILMYPYGVPGAVNVTLGDVARLEPEEFLNDTLIEFGFKSWLRELEDSNPELASQVYVFNSFFYKKLNKRNIKEGYDSVRKWTSKIDIFSKKYIIVPINENLHWYLAIIYEPEHILLPSSDHHTSAVTRKQARETQVVQKTVDIENQSSLQPEETADVPQIDVEEHAADGVNSETEVEELALSASRSITIANEHPSTVSPASDVKEAFVKDSVSASRKKSPEIAPGSPMKVDTNLPGPSVSEQPFDSTALDAIMGGGAHTPIEIIDSLPTMGSLLNEEVTPVKFYRKSFTKQPEEPYVSRPQTRVKGEAGDSRNSQPRTRIFILDSLGNRHPQAMKQLNKWLELEAMDKKKLESVTPAIAKMVPVPVQPNYCDCGLYILHFSKTFMSDPIYFCQTVMIKDRPSMDERQHDWKADSISQMRQDMKNQILMFSEDWRQQRAAREKQEQQQVKQEQEEDEDSDVAIVEYVKASGKKGKSAKSTRTKT